MSTSAHIFVAAVIFLTVLFICRGSAAKIAEVRYHPSKQQLLRCRTPQYLWIFRMCAIHMDKY